MATLQLLKLRINKSNPSHLNVLFSKLGSMLNMHTTDIHINCNQTLTFLSMSKNSNITNYKVHLSFRC